MCGIFGLVMRSGEPVNPAVLTAATDCIRHRGPDDCGYLLANPAAGTATPLAGLDTDPRLGLPPLLSAPSTGAGVAFGFRRLSILDLSPAGHQPMASPDGKVWVVFNGEVYNHAELRRELEAAGHAFRSHCDTEVVLTAYLQWGRECFRRFTGMWAIAIYDGRPDAGNQRRLVLSRDPFGIKPLFYSLAGGRLAFGSEIKQLLALPWVPRRIHAQAAYDFLTETATDHNSRTMFEAIHHFPPASLAEIGIAPDGTLSFSKDAHPLGCRAYWEIDPAARLDVSFNDAAGLVREAFLKNIVLHLNADVPVGSALSGGIDSSSIVAAVRHVAPQADLNAFSYIAHEDARLSEEKWVDLVTAATGARTVKTRPVAGDLARDISRVLQIHDEPLPSVSPYAQYCVFRAAAEAGVKVMLDGQGADEMMAGYSQHQNERLGSLLLGGRLVPAWRLARSLGARPGRRLGVAAKALLPCGMRRALASVRKSAGVRSKADTASDVLRLDYFREHGVQMQGPQVTASAADYRCSGGRMRQALIRAVKTGLVRLLRLEDRNSMAHSIESRVPFLTTDFVSLVLSLPESYLLSPYGTSKAVFREAMRGITPDAILDRRDKIGFEPPGLIWMRALQPWIEESFAGCGSGAAGILNMPSVRAQADSILSGKLAADDRLFAWLNFIAWQQMHGATLE